MHPWRELNELILITQNELNGFKQATINARELWFYIESKQNFSDWIKNRIEKYGFEEEKDFSINLGKTSEQGGRPSKDYICTLGMGKELAMVEDNERGTQRTMSVVRLRK